MAHDRGRAIGFSRYSLGFFPAGNSSRSVSTESRALIAIRFAYCQLRVLITLTIPLEMIDRFRPKADIRDWTSF